MMSVVQKLTVVVLLLLGCVHFSLSAAGDGEEEEYCITRPEGERCYNVYIPPRLRGKPALVLEFISTGGNKDDQQYMTDYNEIADSRGDFIIARPGAMVFGGTFNVGYCCTAPGAGGGVDDKAFFVDMIEQIDRDIGIDRKRIYATGYSQGGAVSHYLAYQLPEYVAAIATNGFALSSIYFNEAKEQKAAGNFHPVPVLSIHGYNDALYCWGPICAGTLVILLGEFINAQNGWKNWANLNGCVGEPVTLSENPTTNLPWIDIAAHDDHQWIKAYQNCDGGVQVIQYLNSRNHSGEFLGTNGVNNQKIYSERIIEFLMQWELPDEKDWSNRGQLNGSSSETATAVEGEDPKRVQFTSLQVQSP